MHQNKNNRFPSTAEDLYPRNYAKNKICTKVRGYKSSAVGEEYVIHLFFIVLLPSALYPIPIPPNSVF